jgi:hypothetical protein
VVDGATTESTLCLLQLAEKALPEWQQNGCAQMYMNKEQVFMKAIVRAGWAMLACASTLIELAAAQPVNLGCSPANSTITVQSFRCQGGVTIVAENGARYILQDRDGNCVPEASAEAS